MKIHVISDLHIGAGPLDDCDEECEAALVAFVDSLSSVSYSVELVLNGDSFDFVQAEPWRGRDLEARTIDGVPLCFNCAMSCAKADAVIGAHPDFFDALTRFVRREGARLTIMPGNHDADLFWSEVRDIFAERIHKGSDLARGRLHWQLDRVYRPESAPHVWIEHGHQYDPLNSFFSNSATQSLEFWSSQRPPILKDTTGQARLLECIGTRFMIRFLNELDYRYPFVDNIKPFSNFLAIFASSANRLSGGTARAALSAFALARFVSVEAFAASSSLLSLDAFSDSLGKGLIALDQASGGAFRVALSGAGCDFKGRSFDFLAADPEGALALLDFALAHLEVLDSVAIDANSMLGLGADDGTLSLSKGMRLDETQLLRNAAKGLRDTSRCEFVIMGHTHEPVDDPYYKNTGSWTRYWRMPQGEAVPTWQDMVRLSAKLPMSLRHAIVHVDNDSEVTLEQYERPL